MFEKLMNKIAGKSNGLSLEGRVKLECHSASGELLWSTGFMKNLIVNAGLAEVSGLVGNVGSKTAFGYLAVGTSNAANTDKTQTALGSEITTSGLARAAATVTQATTTATDDTLQLDYTWTATGTVAVEEIGIFNAASAGTMLGRKLTTTKTVNNGETLTATYQVIFA